MFNFFKRSPKIITFQDVSSKDLKENPAKALLAWVNEMDKYVKAAVVVTVILVIATPVIIDNLYTTQQRAANSSQAPSYITLNENPTTLSLGSAVTFKTVVNGVNNPEYPMIYLECRQNGVVVYEKLDNPNEAFILGGVSSQWKSNGGPATCKAYLYSYGGKKDGADTIRFLSQTAEFEIK